MLAVVQGIVLHGRLGQGDECRGASRRFLDGQLHGFTDGGQSAGGRHGFPSAGFRLLALMLTVVERRRGRAGAAPQAACCQAELVGACPVCPGDHQPVLVSGLLLSVLVSAQHGRRKAWREQAVSHVNGGHLTDRLGPGPPQCQAPCLQGRQLRKRRPKSGDGPLVSMPFPLALSTDPGCLPLDFRATTSGNPAHCPPFPRGPEPTRPTRTPDGYCASPSMFLPAPGNDDKTPSGALWKPDVAGC